ncbi:hypothetical protein ENSA5_25130 [Enhygromyxa salina]|uniref:Uncharacterized protein n=1 Tax=Enhygromyxa salina TaxID=215803 RepID=A0A2S9YAY5_9BACT|nr:hypothetical protein [Enhygromyxa salina]PRQ02277.1 hypothetical protein ENSA5_25130 [Enhygromyxa salina]
MRVWLRGYELRRRPSPGEAIDGDLVTLDARALDRLLRSALADRSVHRLRALLQCSGYRGAAPSDAGLGAALRRQFERGELVVVRRPLPTVSPGLPVATPPPVYTPAEPEGIVEANDWVEILVEDEDEQPVSGVAYEIELPDGSLRRGHTNRFGIARLEGIPSGSCKLTLVELDTAAWEYPG